MGHLLHRHIPLLGAAALAAAAASCALDTAGTLFSPSLDAAQEDARPDRTDETHVDLPGDDGDAVDVEIVEFAEIVDRIEEEAFSCTPGDRCPDSRLCCVVGGILGCYDTADGCDCSGNEALCTDNGYICCQVDLGIFACRASLAGCLCDGPGDSAGCGAGLLCCGTVSGGDFLCQPDSEGCFCDPASPDVSTYCGAGKRCCGKPDDLPRCHSDPSGCPCATAGYTADECGVTSPFCCDRGEGLRCGPAEECECGNHPFCGAGYVCCTRELTTDRTRRCHNNACYCQCSQMPGTDCKYLSQDLVCIDYIPLTEPYCGNPLVCW
jgi:hypothetical protein